jgi:hypothetical protein
MVTVYDTVRTLSGEVTTIFTRVTVPGVAAPGYTKKCGEAMPAINVPGAAYSSLAFKVERTVVSVTDSTLPPLLEDAVTEIDPEFADGVTFTIAEERATNATPIDFEIDSFVVGRSNVSSGLKATEENTKGMAAALSAKVILNNIDASERVGALVVGAPVVGARVGALVVGALVVGALVVGALVGAVLGAFVVGETVVGETVVGARVGAFEGARVVGALESPVLVGAMVLGALVGATVVGA